MNRNLAKVIHIEASTVTYSDVCMLSIIFVSRIMEWIR